MTCKYTQTDRQTGRSCYMHIHRLHLMLCSVISVIMSPNRLNSITICNSHHCKLQHINIQTGLIFTENFDGRCALGITNLLISLFQRVRFETLPWQTSSQEVEEHMTQRLEVVSPTLLCKNVHDKLVCQIRVIIITTTIFIVLSSWSKSLQEVTWFTWWM